MHTIFKRISLVFSWSEGGSDTSPFTAVWHRWTGRNYFLYISSQEYFHSPPQNFSFTSLLWIHWYQLLQRYIKLVSEKFDKTVKNWIGWNLLWSREVFLWTMIAPKDTEAIDKSCLQNQSDKMGILTLMVTHIYLLSLNLHSYKSGQCYFSTPMLMVHLYIQGIEKQPTEVHMYKKERKER